MMHDTVATNSNKFRLYSTSELLDMPNPEWLIHKLFPVESLVGLYAPSGHAKSFLALSWALSVAQGGEWFGRSVKQGPVVYVAAEGGRSIGRRVLAWAKEQGCPDIPAAFFLLEGVQVTNPDDLGLLASRIQEREVTPALIVLDTLARCFVGGDENSAQEMGEFVDGLEWLRRETGATVMVVHHTGKQAQELERGSTVLRAAADVMVLVSKREKVVTVRNNKQKDDEEFDDIRLHLKQVALQTGDDAPTSCVLESAMGARSGGDEPLSPYLRKTLSALVSSPGGTATTAQWASAATLKERTLHSHRKKLVEGGFVEEVKRGTFKVTATGLAVVGTAATARHLHMVR
jgi:hypothetical protein